MSDNIEIYLSELDTNTIVAQAGTFSGASTAAITGTHVTLYGSMPVEVWQSAFRLNTDGGIDGADEGVSLRVNKALNLIGTSAATVDTAVTTGLYVGVSRTALNIPIFTSLKINDLTTDIGDGAPLTNGAAKVDFLSELARVVFGSTSSVDLFTNEIAVGNAWKDAVEGAIHTLMTNNFSSQSVSAIDTAIVISPPSAHSSNLKIAKKIYDLMRNTTTANGTISRFSMMHGATATNNSAAFAIGTGYAAVSSDGLGIGAVLEIQAVGTVISQIYIKTIGTGYSKGQTITMSANANATDKVNITLTDVQAKMLNGTLNESSTMTEFPFIPDDVLHIKLTINSKADQKNSSNIAITQVSRVIDLQIKLY